MEEQLRERASFGIRGAVQTIGAELPAVPEKIFMPFFRTKTRGSGLGLPTARRLIETHSGQISVDCPATGGTTVTVRLPASVS